MVKHVSPGLHYHQLLKLIPVTRHRLPEQESSHNREQLQCPLKFFKGAAYLHFHTFYEHSALASFKRYTNHLYIKLNCKKYSITLEIEKWQLFNPESTLAPIHPGP